MKVTIIGMGLIGGSMALALKEKGMATSVIGVDENPLHRQQALELGLADEMKELDEAVCAADLVILAVPVNAVGKLLQQVLEANEALMMKNKIIQNNIH